MGVFHPNNVNRCDTCLVQSAVIFLGDGFVGWNKEQKVISTMLPSRMLEIRMRVRRPSWCGTWLLERRFLPVSPTVFHCVLAKTSPLASPLLHRHTLRQVAWLIYIAAAPYRNLVGQQLQRNYRQHRRQ